MIEPVFPNDIEQLFAIEQAAHLVPWNKGTLQNNLGNQYLNLKYSLNSQIVAFLICYVVLDEATLFNIAVAPQHQGKGYAKQLMNALIEQLQQKGINTLWLEVREHNRAARLLYHGLGFNEVTTRKNYYPTPEGGRENAVVMAYYLQPNTTI